VAKYRKRIPKGSVAVLVCDVLRQIATENGLHIISGEVALSAFGTIMHWPNFG
jgi:hypothetical protein